MTNTTALRSAIRQRYLQTEPDIVEELLAEVTLTPRERHMLTERAAEVVTALRTENNPSIMESFLSEYGLSTKEGVGLMCLAEALLRVPDPETIDELIADKIEPSNWGLHLGQSSSSLVNASTWALLLTGQILDDSIDNNTNANPVNALRQLIKRLGEPVVRTAVSQAMKMLGKQFVLGQTIVEALKEARKLESAGYTYSYDMLGEAARTHEDAERYFQAYARVIEKIATVAGENVAEKPGISIKLSALHPRYEYAQRDAVMRELLPRAQALVDMAANANIGLNIDAEEADRLDLSLDIIESLMENLANPDWDGFGVVVQAYSRRALPALDWLIAQCHKRKQRMMIRLVKGAYWDAEIKLAQELGLANFPVYTRKAHTDLSYIVCAQRLLDNRDVIYPQFATHNAHTVTAIRYLAGSDTSSYEFQRLHGMGEALHQHVMKKHGTRCRIYAPVGAHVDLLAYLVRRLLENGANSSFVNQIVNTELSAIEVARCPIDETQSFTDTEHPAIKKPLALYSPERVNSKGYRINDPASVQVLLDERELFRARSWSAFAFLASNAASRSGTPNINTAVSQASAAIDVFNPANPADKVGTVVEATVDDVDQAINDAIAAFTSWATTPVSKRSAALLQAADLYEANIAELCALVCREAGKHLSDGIAEVREAVDFLRYYAVEAENQKTTPNARGVIACISPWNFPLAIFTGQLAAALAAGNTVIAKPAQQTPLIAARAVELLFEAGIPNGVLQLLPGDGATIGNRLVSNDDISGVCFTGSTGVAKQIEMALANRSHKAVKNGCESNPMLIAETGGLNAMIADTTALTEQVVRDVVMSAFQSAGQRCSALRILYIQQEAEERLLTMLSGALDTLTIADPWHLSTDVGPVIDSVAQAKITKYIDDKERKGQLIKKISVPTDGTYCPPAIVQVSGIQEMQEEIFGPVLHVATFKSDELDQVIEDINASGYGLTFGLHTRIDDRVQHIVDRIHAGNIYVNRNQIGAVVGSQPFGGEGLSGTGPKAGGPHYLPRFYQPNTTCISNQASVAASANTVSTTELQHALDALSIPTVLDENRREWLLPGPTGESNQLSVHACGRVIVIANNADACKALCTSALSNGCAVLAVCSEQFNSGEFSELESGKNFALINSGFDAEQIITLTNLDAVAFAGTPHNAVELKQAMAGREGRILPFVTHSDDQLRFTIERHVCIDTTAAGGNATLLASAE